MTVEIPASIQRLIEEQFDTLAPEDRALLEVASVAGAEFAAAALGATEEEDVEQLDIRCRALARSGRFVQMGPIVSWPDGTVSGGYRFIHALYQEAFYNEIPASRRAVTSADRNAIGARLWDECPRFRGRARRAFCAGTRSRSGRAVFRACRRIHLEVIETSNLSVP
ncbi:hypothetical protein C2W62_26045 [Candidatus Entotheonella serta]|nr:hypothetical protein C2W62_26045 [Candidatus Entotheonella serta]